MCLKKKTLFILVVFLFGLATLLNAQSFTVMTYNIRYDNPGDGENRWDNRKEDLLDQVRTQDPDILGIQEGLIHQVKFLESGLADYKRIGVGREDGAEKGEFAAVYIRKERFEVAEEGTFWLSETPEEVSVGWDAALERVCTWGLLKDKRSGNQAWVFNVHFDHRGEEARLESARLILKKIKEKRKGSKIPVVVMGDLNADPDSPVLQTLLAQLEDTYAEASRKSGPTGTWNGFNPQEKPGGRIDYVLVSPDLSPSEYLVPAPIIDGRYLSDHFPVKAKLDW
jgi:endonuclease/exonuclease/phosphatase family metal-dependent hydrolase